jgi:gluconolactonase
VATAPLTALLDGEVERVATGLKFTEGPVWNHHGFLLFTDILGDTIYRMDEDAAPSPIRTPSRMANGLAYDHAGRLIACEHASSTVTREEPDGTITTLASHYEGKELNSPNDVVVRSDGTIYFTDPPFGRMAAHGVERPRELDFQGVFLIPPGGGDPVLVTDELKLPNGLCFTADESQMYVVDTLRMQIRLFDVRADGTLGTGEIFMKQEGFDHSDGVPDGVKIDAVGNVFCTGPGGIWVTSAEGAPLGVIPIPEHTANLAWGGADLRTLFVTANTSVYAVRTTSPGHAVPFARASDG